MVFCFLSIQLNNYGELLDSYSRHCARHEAQMSNRARKRQESSMSYNRRAKGRVGGGTGIRSDLLE